MNLQPTPPGFNQIVERIAGILGYDLGEKMTEEQTTLVAELAAFVWLDRETFYRKGWQRIVDDETPAIPDLIFDSALDIANLPKPEL